MGCDGGGVQQMAACCLTGTQPWSHEAEAVSDAPQPGAADPPPQFQLSSIEVKNRGSLVTLHVGTSSVLRVDTR